MYNANIEFPLKTVIGAEQTGQTTWGDTGPHKMEVPSLNIYFVIVVILVTKSCPTLLQPHGL